MLRVGDESSTLAEVTAALEICSLPTLPRRCRRCCRALTPCAAADAEVGHLMGSGVARARTLFGVYGDVRGTDTAGLAAVAGRMVSRICACRAGPRTVNSIRMRRPPYKS